MSQEKNVTRNLMLLLVGMIVIYLLQKKREFLPNLIFSSINISDLEK